MPSLPNPDDFPYSGQDEDLPACVLECVAMVCAHLGVDHSRKALMEMLEFDPSRGTPFENIANLSGVRVTPLLRVEEVEQHLAASDPAPVIANLLIYDDEVLGYELSPDPFLHSVVVIAIDDNGVTVSDPLSHAMLSTESHRLCDRAAFERAWMDGFALRSLSPH